MNASDAAAAADLGAASARKSGRDPRWPYVPIIKYADRPLAPTSQVLGRAFATRSEAVAYAEQCIERERAALERKLSQPNYRALRAQHGVTA